MDLESTIILWAHKGKCSKKLRDWIIAANSKAKIPEKSITKSDNDQVDGYLYKIRCLAENSFARIKQFSDKAV